jgi:hypothetical protein
MKIKYTGKSNMIFTTEKIYTAKQMNPDKYGNCFAILDDDSDWSIHAGEYIKEHFEILEEGEI